MSASVTVHERCVWTVSYLHRMGDTPERTIRDMWEAAKQPKEELGIADLASLPTYHRTVAKLVRQGQIEEEGATAPDGGALYRAADQLSPLNTYTLTDLNEALWELSATEALALYLDAVDYYESRAEVVLGKAARMLLKEDPRRLVSQMLKDLAEELEEDRDIFRDPEAAEPAHHGLMRRRLEELARFLYSELGISGKVWDLPTLEQLEGGAMVHPPDWKGVERAVAERVFGDTFIEPVTTPNIDTSSPLMIIAGTDGSSHAGYVRGVPAPRYVEEEGRLVLTFNNSIAYVELPRDYPFRVPSPYHGVPMTRAALEDPHNRGMIISRPWFPDLSDSEFEHMKKAALDVVQFRVDERLINGVARAYGTPAAAGDSGLLPKPNVLIRDGTVTPQEREFQHYINRKDYGDVVREGIALSYSILRAVKDSEHRVFAGAAKSTHLRTFSRMINWYVKRYVDEGWDLSKVSHVTDTVAVTRLLTVLPHLSPNEYYRTCVMVRPFWALDTNFRGRRLDDTVESWLAEFRRRREIQIRDWREHGGEIPRLLGIDLEDDPFVRMCQEADYAVFYFGRPGDGEPSLTLPRFEFMDALRALPDERRVQRVARATELIMAGVHVTKWSLDREHNFMSQRKMPRLIPYVVYEAHEKCKTLGHKLESELKQAIAMRLSELKKLRGLPVPKIHIDPVPIRDYLSAVHRRLLPGRKADEGKSPSGEV